MAWTLAAKIEAEHRMRELLRSEGMPQPDEVEYGYTCVRFLFHESKTCVVIDLDPCDSHTGPDPGTGTDPGTGAGSTPS
ncbi:MAG TPA: hypothetical protein VIK04_19425 [Solirubrobacteraceae bacterium]